MGVNFVLPVCFVFFYSQTESPRTMVSNANLLYFSKEQSHILGGLRLSKLTRKFHC